MWVRLCLARRARKVALANPPLLYSPRTSDFGFAGSVEHVVLRKHSQLAVVDTEPAVLDLPVPDPKLAEVILAIPRGRSGKGITSKERRAGRVPSIVASLEHGEAGGDKRLISVETKQMLRLLKRIGKSYFVSRTFELEVRPSFDSADVISRERVLPRWVHLHAGTDEILNVTFLRAPAHAVIKVNVPLLFRGEDACPGLRKGGYLNTIKRTLPYRCPTDHIPPYVEVDLSNLEIGDKVLMCDLKVHPALKLVYMDNKLPVCKVMGSRYVADEPSTAPA